LICKPKGTETHGIYQLLTYAAYVTSTGCKPKYKGKHGSCSSC